MCEQNDIRNEGFNVLFWAITLIVLFAYFHEAIYEFILALFRDM